MKKAPKELARAWDNFRRKLPPRFADIEQPLHHAFYCGAWTIAKCVMDAAGEQDSARMDAVLGEIHTYMRVMFEAAEEDDENSGADHRHPRHPSDKSVS